MSENDQGEAPSDSPSQAMFLLGAGASFDAGLPLTVGVTREVFEQFQGAPRYSRFVPVLSTVIGALQFQRGQDIARQDMAQVLNPQDPFDGIDVEQLYNAIELLGRRESLNIAPLIERWHPMIDELDTVQFRDAPKRDIARSVEEIAACVIDPDVDSGEGGQLHAACAGLERALSKFEQQLTPGSARGQLFEKTCEAILSVLKKILLIEDETQADYMRPLARLAKTKRRLVIATLNYDNVVEAAFQQEQVDLTPGIDDWNETGKVSLPDCGTLLLKLHGSLDWEETHLEGVPLDPVLPQMKIRRIRNPRISEAKPAVIFGEGNKLRPEGPFLDLLGAFKASLDEHERLVVIGYSFRDHHINALISRWYNADARRKITVVDPGFGDNARGFADQLRRYGRERLKVIHKGAAEALQDAHELTD